MWKLILYKSLENNRKFNFHISATSYYDLFWKMCTSMHVYFNQRITHSSQSDSNWLIKLVIFYFTIWNMISWLTATFILHQSKSVLYCLFWEDWISFYFKDILQLNRIKCYRMCNLSIIRTFVSYIFVIFIKFYDLLLLLLLLTLKRRAQFIKTLTCRLSHIW